MGTQGTEDSLGQAGGWGLGEREAAGRPGSGCPWATWMTPGPWQAGQLWQGPRTWAQDSLSEWSWGPSATGGVRRAGRASLGEHRARWALGDPTSPPHGHSIAPPPAPTNWAPVTPWLTWGAGPEESSGHSLLMAETGGQTSEVSLGVGRECQGGCVTVRARPPRAPPCPPQLPGRVPWEATFPCLPAWAQGRRGNLAGSQAELPRRRPPEGALAAARGPCPGLALPPAALHRPLPAPRTSISQRRLTDPRPPRLRDRKDLSCPLPRTDGPWGQWPAL